jgi:hypothetical protein
MCKENITNSSIKDFLNSFCTEKNVHIDYILKTNATTVNDFEL